MHRIKKCETKLHDFPAEANTQRKNKISMMKKGRVLPKIEIIRDANSKTGNSFIALMFPRRGKR